MTELELQLVNSVCIDVIIILWRDAQVYAHTSFNIVLVDLWFHRVYRAALEQMF